MDNKIKKLLFDIHSSIENIENYLGEKRDFEVYANNQMLQHAVERNIEFIGEAVNKLLSIYPMLPSQTRDELLMREIK